MGRRTGLPAPHIVIPTLYGVGYLLIRLARKIGATP